MDRILNLSCWRDGRTARCEPLDGGITNRNYVVHDAGEQFVVRLCEDRRFLGIDRVNERLCAEAAAAAGIAPDVFYFEEGILVTRFVDGRTLTDDDVRDGALIKRLGARLRQLHDSTTTLTGELLFFCPFQTIRTYVRTAREAGASLPSDMDELVADSFTLGEFTYAPRLCHNDLLAANLIDDGNQLWIVDWEYAGIGHHLFDLAGVSANCGLSDSQEATLLESYGSAASDEDLRTMQVLKSVSLLREALWSMIQKVKSDLDFDYDQYTADNLAAYREARRRLDD